MRRLSFLLPLFVVFFLIGFKSESSAAQGKLRIICFGAHPDDAELKAGGVAAMWAARGHEVKLVAVTNGDIGHWNMAGGPLAMRRAAESRDFKPVALGVKLTAALAEARAAR